MLKLITQSRIQPGDLYSGYKIVFGDFHLLVTGVATRIMIFVQEMKSFWAKPFGRPKTFLQACWYTFFSKYALPLIYVLLSC